MHYFIYEIVYLYIMTRMKLMSVQVFAVGTSFGENQRRGISALVKSITNAHT